MTQTPDSTKIESERPQDGRSRLARGLQALVDETERQPDGLRNSRRSVVKALFPHEAERITAILERTTVERSERGTAKQAAAILGAPTRTIQDLAARGEIPGAAKLGRCWTFDLEKLRRLVRQKERETWQYANRQPDVSGGAKFFGAGFRFAGENSDGRFTRVTRRLRGGATKPAKND